MEKTGQNKVQSSRKWSLVKGLMSIESMEKNSMITTWKPIQKKTKCSSYYYSINYIYLQESAYWRHTPPIYAIFYL